MTIRFSPARNRPMSVYSIAGGFRASVPQVCANDNGLAAPIDSELLTLALRHFADHGLCAAQRALELALEARSAGDAETYEWWLSICRLLDRRLADRAAAEDRVAG